MQIILSNQSGQPIYEQIATQIKNQILSGQLQPGEMLPSIRALAKDLRISVITTKRAYDELEQQGFLSTVAGKVSFVRQADVELIREENLKKIEALISEILALAAGCGLGYEELAEMLALLAEKEES